MFKVPGWEDDTPKVNLSFPKKAKTNNKKNKKLLEATKLKGVIKPKLKDKNNLNKNFKLVDEKQNILKNNSIEASKGNIINSIKKNMPSIKKHKLKKAKDAKKEVIKNEANDNLESVKDNKKDEKFYDTDKLDELILNEEKQKLNSYKKDDIEEILFNDNSENIKIKSQNLENRDSDNNNKKTTKTNQQQSVNKAVKAKVNKKNGALKSILQKGNNSAKTKVLHELENQIFKTKDERKEKVSKTILQNGKKSNLENVKTKELHQLGNEILKTNENKTQKSILQNGNKSKSENKISKEINTLAGGNKIIKIKDEKKKDALKAILRSESHRNSINVSGNKLRERMLERLKAAQFRYLNEKLYTSSGSDAKQLFQEDPEAFQTYHEGYQQQVKRWPVKPLDVIVKRIQKMPKTHTIADMGCGEAELSTRVVQPVRSFDLVASKPAVEPCDMAHTPLLSSSMDVAVYCLALMGTDLTQYLLEANRVLKVGGHLLIAEVESRFHDVESFTRDVQKLGFSLKKIDKSQKVFFFMEFTKVREPPVKRAKLPVLSLKPCIYKKR